MIKLLAILLITFNSFWILEYLPELSMKSKVNLTMLDVGQGDSALIESNDGAFILIDSGKSNFVIDELFEALPINFKHFDLVIATHADADHIEGMLELITRFEVKRLVHTINPKRNELWNELINIAHQNKVEILQIHSGTDISIGCCMKLESIWPIVDEIKKSEFSANDVSLSFILEAFDIEVFLGGDLGKENEEIAIKKYLEIEQKSNIDVLKVSHHGSCHSTSEDFIAMAKPDIALVSVGRNSYGHPCERVTQLLEGNIAQVYRSDISGRVKLSWGEESEIKIEAELSN